MQIFSVVFSLFVMAVVFIGGGMWGCPKYNVWQQDLAGQAELAKARQNRQIRIEEASAEREAAKLDAEAEVERARGVAEANTIVADSLGGPEGYLRYLWIQKVASATNDTIYVPTEAGLPILEASRLDAKSK